MPELTPEQKGCMSKNGIRFYNNIKIEQLLKQAKEKIITNNKK